MTELGVGVNKLEERESPLLSQEGWREAPGWFQSGNLASWRLSQITHIPKFICMFRIYCDPKHGCWFAEGVYD